MSLADDLVRVVDSSRQLIQDLGFRVRVVKVRTITRAGAGLAALGADTNSDLTLSPRPQVRNIPDRTSTAAGLSEEGDLFVKRISKTYTRSQLDPVGNSVWLIDDDAYRVVGIEERPLEWIAHVRRTRR